MILPLCSVVLVISITFILSCMVTVAIAFPAYIGRLKVSALITSITSLKRKRKQRYDVSTCTNGEQSGMQVSALFKNREFRYSQF